MEGKNLLSEIYENNVTFAELFETLMSKGSHAISPSAEKLLERKKVRKNGGLEHYNRFSNDDGYIVVGKNVCANKYLVMYILDFVIEDPISIYSVQLSCCELRSWKHSKLHRLKLLWVFNSLEKTIERMIQRHGSIRGNRLGSLKLCRNNVDDKEAQVLTQRLTFYKNNFFPTAPIKDYYISTVIMYLVFLSTVNFQNSTKQVYNFTRGNFRTRLSKNSNVRRFDSNNHICLSLHTQHCETFRHFNQLP